MADQQIKGMLQLVENLWACFDELLGDLKTPADWEQKHGADWTFADVPFHMMYADRDLVAGAIRRGQDVPVEEQKVQRTLGELNDWNSAKFKVRPADQTPQQSWDRWRAVRDEVRAAFATLQDEDIMTKLVWFPLVGCGWVPAVVPIGFAVGHSWSELIQLRYHMGRSTPEPAPEATHAAVNMLVSFLPAFRDKEASKDIFFTSVIEITGPGGGDWTVEVGGGECTVVEGRAMRPDMVMSESAETFELLRQSKLEPGAALQSGALKVDNMDAMMIFGSIFAPPSLDKQIDPVGVGAMG